MIGQGPPEWLAEGRAETSAGAIFAMWSHWDQPWLEHLTIGPTGDGLVAQGAVNALVEGDARRVEYRVECDRSWRCSRVGITVLGRSFRSQELRTDGAGAWRDGRGEPIGELDGCLDVDISCTPFTNTLAIQRLRLRVGESADLQVAYVAVPELTVHAVPQRYTRLDDDHYRYDGLFRGFSAVLTVDDRGLVRDYPGTFRRLS